MDASASLPLFPLPQVLLYPEAILPLHLFEPRYCQLISDMVQSGEARMVIAALRPGYEARYFEDPPVYDLAGVGRVLKCHRLPDGRWNIVLRGERRVKILGEVGSGRLYRRVRVMELTEARAEAAEETVLRNSLWDALRVLLGTEICPPECMLPGYLADVLLLQLPLSFPERQALFAVVDPQERARRVLECYSTIRQLPPNCDPHRN